VAALAGYALLAVYISARAGGVPGDMRTIEMIFQRIRAPVKKNDEANQHLRDTQAYMYYMPRLGGDNGKSISLVRIDYH